MTGTAVATRAPAREASASRPKAARLWQRDDLDWYQEPEWATAALLAKESFHGRIIDPSCGGGNIVRACRSHGLDAFGYDVVDRCLSPDEGFLGRRDFLADGLPERPENVIMNPPFFRAKGAESFIRHARAIAIRKVAAFVDIKFLAGQARGSGLFRTHPPDRIWILSQRPSCPPGEYLKAGFPASGGTADWCWLVWDKADPGTGTRLGWLPRGQA